MTWHLCNDVHLANQKRIRRLMRIMGLMPVYQKLNTSRPAKGQKTYPYLLRVLRVDRPKQVWFSDITYQPVRRGFLYLVAIMDWHTRKVLSWLISNTLAADFCPSRRIYFANRLRGNGSKGKAGSGTTTSSRGDGAP